MWVRAISGHIYGYNVLLNLIGVDHWCNPGVLIEALTYFDKIPVTLGLPVIEGF